jgi:hypothetical protein
MLNEKLEVKMTFHPFWSILVLGRASRVCRVLNIHHKPMS